MLEEILDSPAGPRIITCPDGCTIAIARASACDHGHGHGAEDFHALTDLATLAGRISAYYDALTTAGFSPEAALGLAGQLQTTLAMVSLNL